MQPRFFANPALFRAWLNTHHGTAAELLVGFHKVGSGKASMSWPQAVDEALCFGWIDGVRKRIDANAYTIRFTPRRTGSIWSAVNLRRAAALIAQKRMQSAGRSAYETRRMGRSGIYSYETRPHKLPEPHGGRLARSKKAQRFF